MATPCSLLPVVPSDAEAIACGIDVPSMLNGPLFKIMFPTYSTMSPEERQEMMQWYTAGLEEALVDPGDDFYLKAFLYDKEGGDSNGYTLPVGFCGWEVINKAEDSAQSHKPQQQPQQEQQQDEIKGTPLNTSANVEAKKQRGNQLPETLDVDAWIAISKRLRTERIRILKGHINAGVCRLTFMAVCPDFQKQGIGSMMLQSICDETDKVPGRCMYVLAAPEGVRLYSKFGFEVVGDVETPNGSIMSMLRPARAEAILDTNVE